MRKYYEVVMDHVLMVLFLLIGASKLGLEQYDAAIWVFLSCTLLGVCAGKDRIIRSYEQMVDELMEGMR